MEALTKSQMKRQVSVAFGPSCEHVLSHPVSVQHSSGLLHQHSLCAAENDGKRQQEMAPIRQSLALLVLQSHGSNWHRQTLKERTRVKITYK